ncbi:MAG: polysaccharide ABC transporter ATP-binding protein [Flavobacteriales bacterium]
MSKVVLSVENVSKMYRIGLVSGKTLKQDINRWWHTVRGKEDPYLKIGEKNDRSKKGESDFVWVLKNIDFKLEQGETLGIIGRNGAGKSTLLKILSRVTKPTSGNIKVKGRIASLLEVGTGFHPELSGRENIFLNGAILGMRKKEIQAKLDEIIDFSGVERYIDTPVKRYSSGMYVRLAFAVAAHLESEILIIDEVLAVGDAEFQKKCLGKMNDATSKEGRTVLFVSHNMAAVQNLCTKGIYLKQGEIIHQGAIKDTIDKYLVSAQEQSALTELINREDRSGSQELIFAATQFLDEKNNPVQSLISSRDYTLAISIVRKKPGAFKQLVVNVGLNNKNEARITLLSNELTGQTLSFEEHEVEKTIYIHLPKFAISGGLMSFTLFMRNSENILDWITNVDYIPIENGDFYNTGKTIPSNQGDFLIPHYFST